MILHASVYEPELHQGFKVLVMRYWPRGISRSRVDLWLREAAPSRELLHAYTHDGLGWAEFDRLYRGELSQRPAVLSDIRALEQTHGCLTLLCHERIPPREHCHRQILAGLLNA